MSDGEGGIMTRRVRVIFEDGGKTNAEADLLSENPTIKVGGADYDLESFAATGATVVVNDQPTLKLLQEAGIKARPTGKQATITISVTEQMKERLSDASKHLCRTTTSILVEAAEAWLNEKGL